MPVVVAPMEQAGTAFDRKVVVHKAFPLEPFVSKVWKLAVSPDDNGLTLQFHGTKCRVVVEWAKLEASGAITWSNLPSIHKQFTKPVWFKGVAHTNREPATHTSPETMRTNSAFLDDNKEQMFSTTMEWCST